ncbi:uncharacterized protein LOC107607580 [Arachis ipaensis]|uniref:uncharacterized protein LOC107607580 n=1 Tax=Arachis ipaensis TaxID=130454 RepID=UPI0007AF454B|nr:uncharacterized protein LOC107607580 [Arachis ipaensis]
MSEQIKECQAIQLRSGKTLGTQNQNKEEQDGGEPPESNVIEIKKAIKGTEHPKRSEMDVAQALEQMPLYAKIMKKILNNKRDWKEVETVVLTKECSAAIQRNLPEKLQDPGSFIIPCTIENTLIRKPLCDLGANINLMSLSLMRKLQIEELKRTRICLQLAYRSIKFSFEVVEDLLVKDGHLEGKRKTSKWDEQQVALHNLLKKAHQL